QSSRQTRPRLSSHPQRVKITVIDHYIPSSLLMAALQLPQHVPAIDLASAVRTVTKAPAEAVGLTDRGEIAVGKRADLIRVHLARDLPVVRSVWREGERVA
ncbi:amidohydrolase family protein, partial [Bradyrhizobium sp. 31Argb]|uniref:amidohydrolase family protein n=1 Tax=Bradyrhizobium sp. 31Argb TaxID=3141247 RepID=UPI00374A162F